MTTQEIVLMMCSKHPAILADNFTRLVIRISKLTEL